MQRYGDRQQQHLRFAVIIGSGPRVVHTATGAHSATSPEVEVEARTVLRGWYGPDPDVVLQMIVWAISVWLAPLAGCSSTSLLSAPGPLAPPCQQAL